MFTAPPGHGGWPTERHASPLAAKPGRRTSCSGTGTKGTTHEPGLERNGRPLSAGDGHVEQGQPRGPVVSDPPHITLDSPDVQLRNNRYYGNGVMLFRLAGKTVLDTPPMIAEGVKFPPGAKVADAGGLGADV